MSVPSPAKVVMNRPLWLLHQHVWDPAEDLQWRWDSISENNSKPLQQKEWASEGGGGPVEALKSPKPPLSAYLHQAAWRKHLCWRESGQQPSVVSWRETGNCSEPGGGALSSATGRSRVLQQPDWSGGSESAPPASLLGVKCGLRLGEQPMSTCMMSQVLDFSGSLREVGGRPSTGETDPSPLPHDWTGTSGSGVCIKVLRSDTTTDLNILNI